MIAWHPIYYIFFYESCAFYLTFHLFVFYWRSFYEGYLRSLTAAVFVPCTLYRPACKMSEHLCLGRIKSIESYHLNISLLHGVKGLVQIADINLPYREALEQLLSGDKTV